MTDDNAPDNTPEATTAATDDSGASAPVLQTTQTNDGTTVVADNNGQAVTGTDGNPIAVSDAGVPVTQDPSGDGAVVASPVTGEPVLSDGAPIAVDDDGSVPTVTDPDSGQPVVANPSDNNVPVQVDGSTVPVAAPADPSGSDSAAASAPVDAAPVNAGSSDAGNTNDASADAASGASSDTSSAAGSTTDAPVSSDSSAEPAQAPGAGGDGAVSPAQGNAGVGALPVGDSGNLPVDASGGGSVDGVGTTVTGTPADNTGAGNVPGAPVDSAGGTGDVTPGVPADPLPGDASTAQPSSTVQGIDPAGNNGIQVAANPAPVDAAGNAGAVAASSAQPAPITNPVSGSSTELGGGVAAISNDPQDPTTASGLADGSISTNGPSNVGGGAGVGTTTTPDSGGTANSGDDNSASGDSATSGSDASGTSSATSGDGDTTAVADGSAAGAASDDSSGTTDASTATADHPAAPAIGDIIQGVQDQLQKDFAAGVDSIEATLEATFAQMKTDILDKLNAYNDAQSDAAQAQADKQIDDSGFMGPLADALKEATDKYFGQAKAAAAAITAALPDKALQNFKLSAAGAIEALKHLGQADLTHMSSNEKEMIEKLRGTLSNIGQHGLAFFHLKR